MRCWEMPNGVVPRSWRPQGSAHQLGGRQPGQKPARGQTVPGPSLSCPAAGETPQAGGTPEISGRRGTRNWRRRCSTGRRTEPAQLGVCFGDICCQRRAAEGMGREGCGTWLCGLASPSRLHPRSGKQAGLPGPRTGNTCPHAPGQGRATEHRGIPRVALPGHTCPPPWGTGFCVSSWSGPRGDQSHQAGQAPRSLLQATLMDQPG